MKYQPRQLLLLGILFGFNALASVTTSGTVFRIYLSEHSSMLGYNYDEASPTIARQDWSDIQFMIQAHRDSLTGNIILKNDTQEFNLGKPATSLDTGSFYFPLQSENFKLELTDSPGFPYPCWWSTGWGNIPGICQSHQMKAHFVKLNGEEFNVTCEETRNCPLMLDVGCPGLTSANRQWQLVHGGTCRTNGLI